MTRLFELSSYELDNSGSDLSQVVKRAGYDQSPRSLINEWNCWDDTLGNFLTTLAGIYAQNKHREVQAMVNKATGGQP